MAVPNMSKERYDSLTKRQKITYWAIVLAVVLFIGYMIFLY